MIKIISYFTLFSVSLIILNCTNSERVDSNKFRILEETAVEKISGNYILLFNSDSSFAVCHNEQIPTPEIVHPVLNFFVFDISAGEIIFNESLQNGTIEWINDTQVKVSYTPTVIRGDQEDESYYFIYDIQKREKLN
ncbi:MAG: hypothetical protein K9J16_04055 [Melioribacteraceae bacterium]|nr:hypothetical protein [Melioribacteraceae bacterium]MCF8353709.1 hypothetical protein [Melioribacteraceae bacterium]MCF8394962.1 hypothetical protein [Melioribacteraceae bacterium]MCF8418625.1 hypothetical protein [Melioribacteraceae bacterium]